MSRLLLGITALFYNLLGAALIYDNLHTLHLQLKGHTSIEKLILLLATSDLFGAMVVVAGLASILAWITYPNHQVRIVAAGCRAGAMSALVIVQTLAVIFFSAYASIAGLVILIYLTILTFLSAPPPVPSELAVTIAHIQEEREHDANAGQRTGTEG